MNDKKTKVLHSTGNLYVKITEHEVLVCLSVPTSPSTRTFDYICGYYAPYTIAVEHKQLWGVKGDSYHLLGYQLDWLTSDLVVNWIKENKNT